MMGSRLFTESQSISLQNNLLITDRKNSNFTMEKQKHNCSELLKKCQHNERQRQISQIWGHYGDMTAVCEMGSWIGSSPRKRTIVWDIWWNLDKIWMLVNKTKFPSLDNYTTVIKKMNSKKIWVINIWEFFVSFM